MPWARCLCEPSAWYLNKVCLWGCTQDNQTTACPGHAVVEICSDTLRTTGSKQVPKISLKFDCVVVLDWDVHLPPWGHPQKIEGATRHNRITSFDQWSKQQRQCSTSFLRIDHGTTGEELEFPLCGPFVRLHHRRAARHWTQKGKKNKTYTYTHIKAKSISKLVKCCWGLEFVQYVPLFFEHHTTYISLHPHAIAAHRLKTAAIDPCRHVIFRLIIKHLLQNMLLHPSVRLTTILCKQISIDDVQQKLCLRHAVTRYTRTAANLFSFCHKVDLGSPMWCPAWLLIDGV